MNYSAIQKKIRKFTRLLKREEQRQKEGIELIASENYVSTAVLTREWAPSLPINIVRDIRGSATMAAMR